MNSEINPTKPDNHYVNIRDDSEVVKLYLHRHKDTIVSEYNELVPELITKLNTNTYNNQLTEEHLQIPDSEEGFDAPEYIYTI